MECKIGEKLIEVFDTSVRFQPSVQFVLSVYQTSCGPMLCYRKVFTKGLFAEVLNEISGLGIRFMFVSLDTMRSQIGVLLGRHQSRRYRKVLRHRCLWFCPEKRRHYLGMIGQGYPGVPSSAAEKLAFYYNPEEEGDLVSYYWNGGEGVDFMILGPFYKLHEWLIEHE